MMSLRDKEALYATKEEGEGGNTSTPPAASSSSRQWSSSGLKNPRIVRVSRTFGGKDRHSKVCTIKGLRDRRIRLSVPTAIQLYDLQDRLGLGQPSKVIDWLLDNTKHDIDKLPPLPAIPGTFDPFTSQGYNNYGMSLSSSNNPFFDANMLASSSSRREGGININSLGLDVNEDPSIVAKFKYWDSKQKEIDNDDHQGAIGESTSGGGGGGGGNSSSQVFAQNFFPIASGGNATILPPSTFLSNNNHPMYNYNYHWDPSHLALTQLGGLGLSSQNDHHHQGNNNTSNSSSIPSQLALSSGSQLFLSPSMASTSSLFPPHGSYPHLENDIRQFNRSHLSNNSPFNSSLYTTSSGLGLRPFPLSMSHHSNLHQSDDNKNIDDNTWKESSRNN